MYLTSKRTSTDSFRLAASMFGTMREGFPFGSCSRHLHPSCDGNDGIDFIQQDYEAPNPDLYCVHAAREVYRSLRLVTSGLPAAWSAHVAASIQHSVACRPRDLQGTEGSPERVGAVPVESTVGENSQSPCHRRGRRAPKHVHGSRTSGAVPSIHGTGGSRGRGRAGGGGQSGARLASARRATSCAFTAGEAAVDTRGRARSALA